MARARRPVGINSFGQATFSTHALGIGSHTVTVNFLANTNYAGSSSNTLIQQIVTATQVSVFSSGSPSVYGQSQYFSTIVSGSSSGSGTPTGTVTFVIDNVPQTPVPLTNGTAAFLPTPALAAGSHTVSVNYNGSANYVASSSTTLTQTVTKANTSVAVSSNGTPVYGSPVTFTATVSDSSPNSSGTPNGGTVTFTVDGTAQTPAPVSNGQATLTLQPLQAGANPVTATYNGDNLDFNPSSASPTFTQTVTPAPTSTAVTSVTPNPASFGQPVTITATVASSAAGAGIPAGGTVTLVVDGSPPAELHRNPSNGTATFSISTLSTGSHQIAAIYNGGSNFAASSQSVAVQLTVGQAGTATVISSSANPSVIGQAVTFTASVTSPGGSAPTTGTVTFVVDSATQQPSVNLNSSGQATFSFTFTTPGPHTVKATYNGSPSYTGSTSATFNQTVGQAATSTTISSSLNPTTTGTAVTFTATVSAAPSTLTPTGSVTFTINGVTQSSSVILANGQASITTSGLNFGSNTISAVYNPTGSFTGSTSPNFIQKVLNGSSTMINSSLNPSVFGQPVTYTAIVSASPANSNAPTGSVTFVVDNGSPSSPVTLNNGTASITLSNLGVGPHTVIANYSGDNNFVPSSSFGLSQTVNKDTSATTVSPNLSSSVYGQPVTLYAASWAFAPGAGTPSGTETIYIDNVSQGPVNITSGTNYAAFTISTLSVGTHTIYAKDSGDGNFTSSTSTTLTFTVGKDLASNTISSNVSGSVFGQTVSFYGAAWAFPPGGGTPTGTMLYYLDGNANPIASVNIANGVNYATLNLNSLTVGAHTLQTRYLGDSNFIGNVSNVLHFTVFGAATATVAAASAPTLSYGQAVAIYGAVYVVPPGTGTPTGQVTFTVDGVQTNENIINGTNYADLVINNLGIGTHTITATYDGAGNFQGSTAAPISVTVQDPSGATQLYATTSAANNNLATGTTFSVFAGAFDANGNPTPGFTNRPATIAVIATPSTGGTVIGSAGNSFSTTFVNGGAEFDGLSVTAPGTYTLRITSGVLYYDLTFTTFGRQT